MSEENEIERLGELLIEEGIITHEEVAESLRIARRTDSALGRLLLSANPVRRRELASFLAMDVRTVSIFAVFPVSGVIAAYLPSTVPSGVAAP